MIFGRGDKPASQDSFDPDKNAWLSSDDLFTAVATWALHSTIAIEALRAAVGPHPIDDFVCERMVELKDYGTSTWQEVSVLSGGRLIFWHSEDMPAEEEPGGLLLQSSLRCIPLSAILDVCLRTWYRGVDTGFLVPRTARLYMATGTPAELSLGTDEAPTRVSAEMYRWCKTLEDDSPEQIARLISFGQLAERLVAAHRRGADGR